MRSNVGFGIGALGLVILGCATVGDNTNEPKPLDPVKMEAYIQRNFSHIPNLTGALSRVIAAANGAPQPGVTFTETANGIVGTVLVDVKGDGTDSAKVDATITYTNPSQGIFGGATATVTSLKSPNLEGTANATIAVNGTGSNITFSNGSADLQYTDGPRLFITNANIAVSTGTSLRGGASFSEFTILGSTDFHADSKTGTIFFESNGAGGWRIRVVSPDFDTFTAP